MKKYTKKQAWSANRRIEDRLRAENVASFKKAVARKKKLRSRCPHVWRVEIHCQDQQRYTCSICGKTK